MTTALDNFIVKTIMVHRQTDSIIVIFSVAQTIIIVIIQGDHSPSCTKFPGFSNLPMGISGIIYASVLYCIKHRHGIKQVLNTFLDKHYTRPCGLVYLKT